MVKSAVFGFVVVVLTACSVTPDGSLQSYQLADMQYLQLQKSWSFEGRLALVNERESVSASINWHHSPERDDIALAGPLAQGRMVITVVANGVVIDDGDNRREYLGQVDRIVAAQLGMDMPINALKYWVLGVNDPEQSFMEHEGGFFQEGWLVRFREMQRVNSDWLPKKVIAEKDKTRIKLIVDRWDLS